MRVVFLEDVPGVAHGGDVKEVKNGFARNYLIPQNLAVPATHNALQRIRHLADEAEKNRMKLLSDMRALAEVLDGVRVDVEMRSGASGQLYGSVTNAIVADKLSELTDSEIDRRTIQIDEPIRQLGVFDVNIRLHPEVDAQIKVVVYPMGTDPDAMLQGPEEAEEAEEGEAEAEPQDAEEAALEAEIRAEEEAAAVAEVEGEAEESEEGPAEAEAEEETEESEEAPSPEDEAELEEDEPAAPAEEDEEKET